MSKINQRVIRKDSVRTPVADSAEPVRIGKKWVIRNDDGIIVATGTTADQVKARFKKLVW